LVSYYTASQLKQNSRVLWRSLGPEIHAICVDDTMHLTDINQNHNEVHVASKIPCQVQPGVVYKWIGYSSSYSLKKVCLKNKGLGFLILLYRHYLCHPILTFPYASLNLSYHYLDFIAPLARLEILFAWSISFSAWPL